MAVWDYPCMRRPDGRGRLVWAAFATLFCLATLRASHGESIGSWSRFVSGTAAAPFRLGTAARPFAWSTAVGDLNGDGTLDYAVADHIGRDLAGFEYSIDLSISGLAAQRVTFSSPSAALSIALRDVDHDQDLDVVISTERRIRGVHRDKRVRHVHLACDDVPGTGFIRRHAGRSRVDVPVRSRRRRGRRRALDDRRRQVDDICLGRRACHLEPRQSAPVSRSPRRRLPVPVTHGS
jgi:hypothetical protein